MATVTYTVPLIAQCGGNTCWYAAAQMIVAYRRASGGTAPWTVIGRPHLTGQVCSRDQALNLDSPQYIAQFAQNAGLRMIRQWPQSADSMAHLLSAHGPLWYCGTAGGYRGLSGDHVIVITGIRDTVACINDPWPVNTGWQGEYGFDNLRRNLPQVAFAPLLAYGSA
jgi:hypothetical protein